MLKCKIVFVFGWIVFSLGMWAQTPLTIVWQERPGIQARDISIGGYSNWDRVVYAIGKADTDIRYGGRIYRWNTTAYRWDQVSGLAVAVSVSSEGVPWVVNGEGKIFELVGSRWVERPGFMQRMRANDIGMGRNNVVMVISRSDGHIYRWSGHRWVKHCNFAQGANRIDVDYQGNPWVVNSHNYIFQYLNGEWQTMMTSQSESIWAWDVGADCRSSDVWAPREDSFQSSEGGPLYYSEAGLLWWNCPLAPEQGMKCVRIDINNAQLWTVTASGAVYEGNIL